MSGVITKFSTPVTVGMLKEWLEDVEDHFEVSYILDPYGSSTVNATQLSYNPYTKKVVLE